MSPLVGQGRFNLKQKETKMENKELKQEKEDSQLLAELLLAKLEDEKEDTLYYYEMEDDSLI